MDNPITAYDIRNLLRNRFSDTRRYAMAEEVSNSTGSSASRRIDMIVVDVYESSGFSIEGIEIKISKQDLKRELSDASKHNIFFDDIDFFSLAAPKDIIDVDVIPKHWGIYEAYYDKNGELKLRCKRRPIALSDFKKDSISRNLFASLIRKLYSKSPSNSTMRYEYLRGYHAGEKMKDEEWNRRFESKMREYDGTIERAKIYDDLLRGLGIYSEDSKDARLRELEAARKIFMFLDERTIRRTIESLNAIEEAMKGRYDG